MYYNSSARRRGGFKRRFSVSSAPRSWYVKKAIVSEQLPNQEEKISFSSLGLSAPMLKTLSERDYLHATPIQAQAIPHIQAKKDVLGIAQTGTGKTGAFLIPLIEHMYQASTQRTLVIVPTRELAQQIADEFFKFTKYQRASCAVCVGGASMFQQLSNLRRQPRLVVGTPGRLKDLIQRRALPMSTFTTVVLDEVDRMVDMGFIDDIRFPHWKECVESGIDLTKDWVIARTTAEAKAIVEARGMPTSLALDHDLGELPTGGIDEVPDFLNWLACEYWDGESPIVESYTVHSSNTPGVERIISIMESWKKSLRL
jgi:hypothetical protein